MPFGSEGELATAKGKTVYLVRSMPLQQHDAPLGAGVHGLIGLPLLLCEVSTGPNRHIIQSEEVVRALTVLAKTPGGMLVDVRLEYISPRTPHFSLASPTGAVEMLLGAFREARESDAALRGSSPVTQSYDRTSHLFWKEVARSHEVKLREEARTLISELVHGMGAYERYNSPQAAAVGAVVMVENGSARAAKGEDARPWVDHADETVQRLAQLGIPKGPVRERYLQLKTCAGSAKETSTECTAADMLVADPPAIPLKATTGGTLVLRIAPKRALATVTLTVDGKPVAVTSEYVTVPVDRDGVFDVHVLATGMRAFDRKVPVRSGASVEVPVVLLPK